jgi:arylsulfatase A-like enzyme
MRKHIENDEKSRRSGGFRIIFSSWYIVPVSVYLLVLLPFLVLPADLTPITDQVVAHAFILTAMMIATALWAAALAGLALALSLVSKSERARGHVIRSSASIVLSLFIYLILAFAWSGVRGGDPREAGILDLLLSDRFMGLVLAALIVLFHVVPGTRFANHLDSVYERMGRLGFFFACCTVPFILILPIQFLLISLPSGNPPTVRRPTPAQPNIVVIVLDALPMAKTSFAPKGEDLTPSLRRFSEKSLLFNRAYTPANFTSPSVVTLLTGKDPVEHGIYEVKMSLQGEARKDNLPAELQRAGFATGAMVANFEAHPRLLKLDGFDRVFPMGGRGWIPWMVSVVLRFADFHLGNLWSFSLESWFLVHVPDRGHTHPWPPGPNFLDGLAFLAKGDKPQFAYIHVMPPHSPFLADPPWMYSRLPVEGFMDTPSSHEIGLFQSYPESEKESIGMLEKRYEETVLSVDHRIGRFLDDLEAAGRFEDSIIVVLSDHGEMFEPRWVAHHGPYLDDALVHVPLLIHLPGQKGKKIIDAPIGLVDIAPTLLDLVGIPAPGWMSGISWKPVFSGGPAPDRPVYSLTSGAISSLVKGGLNKGSCRVTRAGFQAVLDLEERKELLIGPEGDRVVFFPDPKDPGRGTAPGLGSFEDAVREICPVKSTKGTGRVASSGP